jgi:hypothetical protein
MRYFGLKPVANAPHDPKSVILRLVLVDAELKRRNVLRAAGSASDQVFNILKNQLQEKISARALLARRATVKYECRLLDAAMRGCGLMVVHKLPKRVR